ncbi:MAG: helix-turn-helix domain-containing protein [Chloroflexia bacterium]
MDITSEQPVIEDDRITTFGRLIETHALLTHSLDNELRQAVGIPLLWFGVLLHVARSPNQIRPISELVAATAFTNGGVTRLVDRMEAAGLVERLPARPTAEFTGLGSRSKAGSPSARRRGSPPGYSAASWTYSTPTNVRRSMRYWSSCSAQRTRVGSSPPTSARTEPQESTSTPPR